MSVPAAGSFTKKHSMPHDPGLCADDDITCKDWAAAGECVKNKGFMVGADVFRLGQRSAHAAHCLSASPAIWCLRLSVLFESGCTLLSVLQMSLSVQRTWQRAFPGGGCCTCNGAWALAEATACVARRWAAQQPPGAACGHATPAPPARRATSRVTTATGPGWVTWCMTPLNWAGPAYLA
jgi:hypothetical protein